MKRVSPSPAPLLVLTPLNFILISQRVCWSPDPSISPPPLGFRLSHLTLPSSPLMFCHVAPGDSEPWNNRTLPQFSLAPSLLRAFSGAGRPWAFVFEAFLIFLKEDGEREWEGRSLNVKIVDDLNNRVGRGIPALSLKGH